jgi:hypothetical protein
LIVTLDGATSGIYYAQPVEAESTHSVLVALREVIETRGLFCSLYRDRAGHFFVTPMRGEKADRRRPAQVGRALQEMGVTMIAADSPQARGRSGRNFGTRQGRLQQELRLRGRGDLTAADDFLRNEYIAGFNRRFAVAAAQRARRWCVPSEGTGTGSSAHSMSAQSARTTPSRWTTGCCNGTRRAGVTRWPARAPRCTNTSMAGCRFDTGRM